MEKNKQEEIPLDDLCKLLSEATLDLLNAGQNKTSSAELILKQQKVESLQSLINRMKNQESKMPSKTL